MLRQKMFLLAAASLMTAISALPAAAEQVAWQTNLEEAMAEARESNRPVLLHFWTPDCVPCRRLEKSVLNQPRVVETLERQFIPVKVNAQDHPEIARRYHVSSVPVDVVVTANNEELARMYTPQDPDRYVAQLSAIAITEGGAEVAETAIKPRSRNSRPTAIDMSVAQANDEPATSSSEDAGEEAAESAVEEESTRDEAPKTSTVTASSRPKRSSETASDEPEPREVINRFARQNQSDEESDSTPAAPSRKRSWGQWPREAKSEPAEVAAAEATEEEATEPAVEASTDSASEEAPSQAVKPARMASKTSAPSKSQAMGLDGYCPVTLVQKQAWKKGDSRFGVVHRGRTYLFAGQEEKDTFFANPDEFSPALSGIDPVEFSETGEVMDGQREHGVVYQNRVYLFATEKNLETFWQEPERYASRIQQAMETGDFNQLRR